MISGLMTDNFQKSSTKNYKKWRNNGEILEAYLIENRTKRVNARRIKRVYQVS